MTHINNSIQCLFTTIMQSAMTQQGLIIVFLDGMLTKIYPLDKQ